MAPAAPGSAEESAEALVLHFKAGVTRDARGKFKATTGDFPGVVSTGDTQQAALSALEAAILKHLATTSSVALEAVHEEPLGLIPYSALSVGDRLYLGTNLDVVLTTETGKRETWKRLGVTQQQTEAFSVFEGADTEDIFEPGEYLTQLYALASFAPAAGTPLVYAGTNLKGLVYVQEGEDWRPAFTTNEERVHSLAAFGRHLYAGTSGLGRIFRWDGRQAEMVHQAQQLGITALAAHGNALYAGTYPDGYVLRTEDGELWEIVCRTQQKLVNHLLAAPDGIYAACSHPAGGAIFRSQDGKVWERCLFSEKDPNFYSLTNFGGRIYAGSGESGRLYASRDGSHWEVALQSPEAALRVVIGHKGRLFIACERRGLVYRTTATETPAPAIRDVVVSSLSSSRAVVEWATDVPCDATVQYGSGSQRDQTAANPTLSRRHRITLDGLKAGTRYSYLVIARNAEGSQELHLDDMGFTTPVLPQLVLSSTTHPEEDAWYPSRDLRIAWTPQPGAVKYVVKISPQRITHLTQKDTTVHEAEFFAALEADGVWWCAVAGVDEAGNVGEASTRAVRTDTSVALPAVASTSHPEATRWESQPIVEVHASGVDAHAGVEGFHFAIGRVGESWEHLAFQAAPPLAEVVPAGGQPGAASPPVNATWLLPRLPDGTWDIFVRMRDRAGNEGQPVALRVQIDTAPPVVTLEPVPPVTAAGEFELKWQARDERSGIARMSIQQRKDQGDWETVYEGKGASVKVEGRDGDRMWYRVVAEDRAGLRAAAETHQAVLFDGSPPEPVTTVESVSHPGGDVLVRWGPGRDALCEIARYHVYRGAEEGRPGMKVASLPADATEYADEGVGLAHGGRYWYRVCAEDGVGNVQTDGPTILGICDKEAAPPRLDSPSHPLGQWTTLTEAVITWERPVDDTGITEYVWRLDRNPASSLQRGVDESMAAPPLKLPHLLDGVWYVHVSSVDGAGNVSPAAHFALKVVTRPPHARLKPLATILNSKAVKLEWESEEGVVAVAIGVREGGAQEWRQLVEKAEGHGREITVEKEGIYEFSVRALDAYGRWGTWEEGTVTLIDVTPPLEVGSVQATSLAGGSIRLEWEPSWDELSGLAAYGVYRAKKGAGRPVKIAELAGTDELAWTDPCEGAEDGAWFTYTVLPADAAGNVLEGSPAAHAVSDRSAPKPRLVARSHPDPAKSYATRRLEFLWDAAEDPAGLAGLVVELNATPGTQPNPETLPVRSERTLTFDLPEDGRWFVHARSVDGAGNASETVHLSVQVDTHVDPPVASFSQDPFLEWQQSGNVSVVLTAPDDPSGIPAYWWVLDQAPSTAPDRLNARRHTATSLTFSPKAEGLWHLHLAAEDGAGNLSSPVHLAMRLTLGLSMPHIRTASHPEGLWSQKRDVEIAWDPIEGDRVSFLYWIDHKRQEEPPPGAMRLSDPHCRITLEEGIWFFHVCAADERGRKSAAVAYQLRVDATPPELSVYSPSHPKGRWTEKRRVHYAVEVEDLHSGIARVELALTPAGWEPDAWELALGTEGEREVPGEGLWSLQARAVDQAGNHSPVARWDIMVDLGAAPPGISSTTHPEGQWSPGPEVEIHLQPSEDLSGVREYALKVFAVGEDIPPAPTDDAVRTAEEIVRLELPSDGRWTVAAWSWDFAGNLSHPARYLVFADSIARPPSGFVVEPTGEGGWIRSDAVRVFWKAPEEASGEPAGYCWTLDEAAATVPDPAAGMFSAFPELDLGGLSDGVHWLHVRTIDMAGNLSAETVHLKLAVDACPPVLTLTSPEADGGTWIPGHSVSVKASGEDTVSGFTGCFWSLHEEGDEVADITAGRWREEAEWKVEVPHDGVWVLTVAAMDVAGNLSEPGRLTVRVDGAAAPPRNLHSPTHPDAAAWYSAREAAIRWDAPDEVSGIAGYRWTLVAAGTPAGEPASWKRTDKPDLKVPLPSDGRWTFSLATEDGAGNVSTPASLSLGVDSHVGPPALSSSTHPNPKVRYSESQIEVAVSAADDASGLADVLAGISGSASCDPAILKPVSGGTASFTVEKGIWWVHAVAMDRAGNRSRPESLRVTVDPSVRPPLVTCESHPDAAKWYASSAIACTILPAGDGAAQKYLVLLDEHPDTQPVRPAAKAVEAGPLKLSADHSGEWYLHVMTDAGGEGGGTEAVHVRIRVDVTAPVAPEVTSPTHPQAPRRARGRDVEFEWTEPKDVSGIRQYNYVLSRPSLLGTKKEKTSVTRERKVRIAGIEPGRWDFSVSATDHAGQTGGPGKFQIAVADTQDICVVVKSESWRVAREGLEVELKGREKSGQRTKTAGGGEAWFKERPYGPHTVSIALPKPASPLEFEGVDLEDGEPYMRFEVSLAGCAWMIVRDHLRLWVPPMWLEGGRVEILDEKGKAKAVVNLKDMPRRGPFLETPLPEGLLRGAFQFMGGPLNKLQWPMLGFVREPL